MITFFRFAANIVYFYFCGIAILLSSLFYQNSGKCPSIVKLLNFECYYRITCSIWFLIRESYFFEFEMEIDVTLLRICIRLPNYCSVSLKVIQSLSWIVSVFPFVFYLCHNFFPENKRREGVIGKFDLG